MWICRHDSAVLVKHPTFSCLDQMFRRFCFPKRKCLNETMEICVTHLTLTGALKAFKSLMPGQGCSGDICQNGKLAAYNFKLTLPFVLCF